MFGVKYNKSKPLLSLHYEPGLVLNISLILYQLILTGAFHVGIYHLCSSEKLKYLCSLAKTRRTQNLNPGHHALEPEVLATMLSFLSC